MKVLIAGATSTLGGPVLHELRDRGHETVALTRAEKRRASLSALADGVEVADVHQRESLHRTLERVRPDAVVSLLIALPKRGPTRDRKSTRLNSSHANISYAVFCLKKKKSHTPNEIVLIDLQLV